jgi:hypothetical protein
MKSHFREISRQPYEFFRIYLHHVVTLASGCSLLNVPNHV